MYSSRKCKLEVEKWPNRGISGTQRIMRGENEMQLGLTIKYMLSTLFG
jgi:hypothetical protein